MERGECSTSTSPPAKRHRGNTSPAVMKKSSFDVFISHRGCDTKNTLASTIYHTLDMNNIHAFLDREELELGDNFPLEIQEAIRTARLHIAIFSKRYAESPWCPSELSDMLHTGTQIIHVFYHVNPSDLRWAAQGKGRYAPAFSDHEKKGRYDSNKLHDWKMALQRASNLSGYEINENNGDEGMLLKTILDSALRMRKKVPLEVAKHPVGLDEIVQDFEKECVKNEQGVQIVGIVGLGGSGKTTLATEVYNRKSFSIDGKSFLHDVRDAASREILHIKQKKLLEDVRIRPESFDSVKEGKAIITDQLTDLCVLIVLDDVDHEDQLDALLPPKEKLGRGSVVIITTREVDVLTKWGITSIYKVKSLNELHAKQLFCWHAFLQPFPLQGFEDLVESFLNSCCGLPLSLKVIAAQLYGKRSEYWDSQLKKIKKTFPREIMKRLRVSYDALDEDEQEMFLDIACFFIGEKRSWAIGIWDASGWSGLCSWEALQNKCLVESYNVEREEYITMHDHLRDLGRQIAKGQSRQRIARKYSSPQGLWDMDQIQFRGISDSGDRRVIFGGDWGEAESTEKYELLRSVLWFEWKDYKDTSIPSWFPLDTIIVLRFDFAECLETLWEDARTPLQLRELGIFDAPMLQSLPTSIGRLKDLEKLFLCARSLSSLPEIEFGELQSLEHLVLRECSVLSSLLRSIGRLHRLKSLHLDFLGYGRVSYFEHDIGWDIPFQDPYPHLEGSSQLLSLPEELSKLRWLKHFALRGCKALSSLPDRFGDLVNLRHVDLNSCTSLKRLPESFKQLIQLQYLDLNGCESLESLENIPNLKSLDFFYDAFGYEDDEHISPVGQLSLKFEIWKETYPSICMDRLLPSICQLSELQNLTLLGLSELYEISNVAGLVSLTKFEVEDCYNLQKIGGLEYVTSLKNLVVKECDCNLKIQGVEHLTSLENLVLWSERRREPIIHSLWGSERLQTVNLKAENILAYGSYIQNIEMENWPREMTICGKRFSHFESNLDSFRHSGVDVHRMRVCSLTPEQTNLSNTAMVCYLLQRQSWWGHVSIRNVESSRVKLWKGDWIVISVLKEVSCYVEDGGGGRNSLDISLCEEKGDDVKVLDGWVMVGERASILEGLKKLFQTLSM